MPPARVSKKKGQLPGAPALAQNVADMRALAHPLRLRMIELFAEKPRTTKQVAELLDQPPTRLYHHVAALERAGLLVLKETRQNRGATEKWYEAITRQLESPVRSTVSKRAGKAGRRAIASVVMEQAKQELLAAGAGEAPLIARLVIAAPADRIAAVRQRLYEAVQQIRADFSCEGEDGTSDLTYERWAVTMAFAPVWPRRSDKADPSLRSG